MTSLPRAVATHTAIMIDKKAKNSTIKLLSKLFFVLLAKTKQVSQRGIAHF